MPSSFIRSRCGVTLLNVSLILVLIGGLVIAGYAMMGPIIKRGKITDTKTTINSAVDAIISWSVARGHIPGTEAQFNEASVNQYDAWGRKLRYLYDKGLTIAPSGNAICNYMTTGLTINGTPNIAFAVMSLGDDYLATSEWNSTAIDSNDTKFMYPLHDGTNGVTNSAIVTPPDIYRIVTLEELKAKIGCYGKTEGRLRIVNNELPKGCKGTGVATIYADGGVTPYKWCFNHNIITDGFQISNAIEAPDCTSVPSNIWNAFPTSPTTQILYSNTTGTYTATVLLRDNQGTSVRRNYQITVLDCTSGGGISQEFIHGSTLSFSGNSVSGENATIVLTGDLAKNDINGGANVAVTNAYIDGNVTLGGSQILGSQTVPGTIYINGNLDLSGTATIYGKNIYVTGNITLNGSPILGLTDNSTKIYALGNVILNNGLIRGDIYTNGNMEIKSATLNKNAYVGGNLILGWTPTLSATTTVYYKGTLSAPTNFTASILAKCVHDPSLPAVAIPVTMPDTTIPPLRDDVWYPAHGYITNGALVNNAKIFSTGSYTSNAANVTNIVVASKGDITLSNANAVISGVLYAPNGKITFKGESFEGYAIAKDGFYVTRGGSTVTLKSISTYISNTADYPFKYPYP
jgi:hypothetical protein